MVFDASAAVPSVTGSTTASEGYYINSLPVAVGSTTLDTYFLAGASSTAYTSAEDNIAIGENAMGQLTTGDNNVAVGVDAGGGLQGSGNVYIGRSAGFNAGGSNELFIDNFTKND